jgi:HEAT repeat protein
LRDPLTAYLSSLFRDPDVDDAESYRINIMRLTGHLKLDSMLPLIEDTLSEEGISPGLRIAAIEALGLYGQAEKADLIIPDLCAENNDVRCAAWETLRQFPYQPSFGSQLKLRINIEESPKVKAALIEDLIKWRPPTEEYQEPLENCLSEQDIRIRKLAILALATFGVQEVFENLLNAFRDIITIHGQTEDDDRIVQALVTSGDDVIDLVEKRIRQLPRHDPFRAVLENLRDQILQD